MAAVKVPRSAPGIFMPDDMFASRSSHTHATSQAHSTNALGGDVGFASTDQAIDVWLQNGIERTAGNYHSRENENVKPSSPGQTTQEAKVDVSNTTMDSTMKGPRVSSSGPLKPKREKKVTFEGRKSTTNTTIETRKRQSTRSRIPSKKALESAHQSPGKRDLTSKEEDRRSSKRLRLIPATTNMEPDMTQTTEQEPSIWDERDALSKKHQATELKVFPGAVIFGTPYNNGTKKIAQAHPKIKAAWKNGSYTRELAEYWKHFKYDENIPLAGVAPEDRPQFNAGLQSFQESHGLPLLKGLPKYPQLVRKQAPVPKGKPSGSQGWKGQPEDSESPKADQSPNSLKQTLKPILKFKFKRETSVERLSEQSFRFKMGREKTSVELIWKTLLEIEQHAAYKNRKKEGEKEDEAAEEDDRLIAYHERQFDWRPRKAFHGRNHKYGPGEDPEDIIFAPRGALADTDDEHSSNESDGDGDADGAGNKALEPASA